MKRPSSVPAAIGASALACLTILASCTKPSDPTPAPAEQPAAANPPHGGSAPPDRRDPLAAAKSPIGPADQDQAAQDREDDARAQALAAELLAHPDWLARQQALCGPGNGALQARYAALKGPPAQDLRDLKVACLAKDIAERQAGERGSGGVKNTGSL